MKKRSEWLEWKDQFIEDQKCIVAEREGPHKVACREPATHTTPDGCPSCELHQNINAKKSWSGFIEGA